MTSYRAGFLHKTTDYYAPAAVACIRWNDQELATRWPDVWAASIVSAKDAEGAAWRDAMTILRRVGDAD